MSGVNWLPAWSLDRATPHGRFRTIAGDAESPYGIGDMYTGPLLDAQLRFARAVGERLRAHPAVHRVGSGQRVQQSARAGDAVRRRPSGAAG